MNHIEQSKWILAREKWLSLFPEFHKAKELMSVDDLKCDLAVRIHRMSNDFQAVLGLLDEKAKGGQDDAA